LAKILLLSVVIAMMAIPILSARDTNPRRSVRKVILLIFVFNLFYLLAVRFIYPRIV
jgi:8-oxo-dGTP diphosphatase